MEFWGMQKKSEEKNWKKNCLVSAGSRQFSQKISVDLVPGTKSTEKL